MRRRRPKAIQLFRYAVQASVVGYVIALVAARTAGSNSVSELHTVCPLGGVVNLYTYFTDGGYVAKLHPSVFIMLLALVIGLVITGKSFCGWICPLGSVQQALNAIGRRLWPRAYNKLPRLLERVLQLLKWIVLAWVVGQTARSAQLVFQDWDPYYNLFHIWTDGIALSGYAVTGATLLLALFIPRPFCRFACPLGAFNGVFNSFSFITIKRDAASCNSCGRCSKVCPVNIDLCKSATIWSIECTRCLQCIDVCPQNRKAGDALRLHTWFHRLAGLLHPGKTEDLTATAAADAAAETEPPAKQTRRRSVSTWLFAALAVAAFVLPILITVLSGDFQTTGGQGQGPGGGGGSGGRGQQEQTR